jgi:hypothetical protein
MRLLRSTQAPLPESGALYFRESTMIDEKKQEQIKMDTV